MLCKCFCFSGGLTFIFTMLKGCQVWADFEFTGAARSPFRRSGLLAFLGAVDPLHKGGIYPVDVLDKSRLPSSQ